MGLKPDHWIRKMAREHGMIEPFVDSQVRNGTISYGVSSYGYDVRIANQFKIFTNVFSAIVDPKNFDPKSMVDYEGDECIIPPNSFVLGRTVEYFRIPRNVLTICLGKCLTGDTRVVDATTGDYRPLRDFIDDQAPETIALNEWKLGTNAVTAHVNNGTRPVYELVTRAGLKIKATANHPFLTWEDWVQLADLQPGDRIAVARSCPVFGQDNLPLHEATLLGLMLSDGQCHTPQHSPRYTTDDPRLVEVFTQAAHAFGMEVSPVAQYGYNLVNHRGRGGRPEKNRAYAWLETLGCNVQSVHKHIPAEVFRARRESVVAFLQALFAGDGSAYSSGNSMFVEYSTSSERLVYDVHHLLLRFGIFGLVRQKESASGRTSYRIQITDRAMIQRFAEEIGFVPGSRKAQALRGIVAQIVHAPAQKSNFDTLPPAAWATMRDTAHALDMSLNAVGITRTAPQQSLPYKTARQVGAVAADTLFTEKVEADVIWDTVQSITFVGEEEVFDLTVPGAHNFLANDMIVHNSTYARCGLIVNVTPFEPEWEGYVTLEISNTTPLPAKIYSNEGIAQVLFFEADEECETSYADKKGKYQSQQGIVLPKM